MEKTSVILLSDHEYRLPRYGGDTNYLHAHAKAAHLAGYEVTIICLSDREDDTSLPYGEVRRIKTSPHLKKGVWMPFYTRRLLQKVEDIATHLADHQNVNRFILHSFGISASISVLAARRLNSINLTAVSVHNAFNTYLDEKISLWLGARNHALRDQLITTGLVVWAMLFVHWWERFGLRNVDRLLVNYQCVANKIRETHGHNIEVGIITYSPATTCSPAARSKQIDPHGHSLDTNSPVPVIVCTSRPDPRKGIEVLIDALAILHQNKTAFQANLISSGPLLDAMRTKVQELGLGEVVALPGWVEDVRDYLEAADIFVLPSIREQSGSVSLLEAMEAGLAPVAADCDGIPEDIEHGKNGLLFPAGNSTRLAECLYQMLKDPVTRRVLATNAAQTFSSRFAMTIFSQQLGSEYRKVMHSATFGLS